MKTVSILLFFSKFLIKGLGYYEVSGNKIHRLESFLRNCKKCIPCNTKNTSFSNTNCGVPQGSIVEPLLFLIHVNDLCNALNILDCIMFADDTNLIFQILWPSRYYEVNVNNIQWFKSFLKSQKQFF